MGGGEQIYNPVSGINRMITDVENALNPVMFQLHPLMRIMGIINLGLVAGVFFLMLFYMYFIRKHRLANKLRNPENYITSAAVLLVYIVLNMHPLKLGPYIELNFGLIAMPVIAKQMGPLVACIFGFLQYGSQFLTGQGDFSITSALLGCISGMIYARFLYDRRTKYLRCLWAKLLVNIVCNILLVPMVTGDVMTVELADQITKRLISNIFLAPIQAAVIYAALLGYRKIKELIRNMR